MGIVDLLPTPGSEPPTDIYVVRVLDGAEFNITQSAASESNPEWSPDGRWLAYLERDGSAARLMTVCIDGLQRVGEPVLGPLADEFEWSPDASQLVFARSIAGRSEILVTDPGFTRTPMILLSVEHRISSLSWQRLAP